MPWCSGAGSSHTLDAYVDGQEARRTDVRCSVCRSDLVVKQPRRSRRPDSRISMNEGLLSAFHDVFTILTIAYRHKVTRQTDHLTDAFLVLPCQEFYPTLIRQMIHSPFSYVIV